MHRLLIKQDAAATGFERTDDALEQRRFASGIWSEYGGDFSGGGKHVHIAQHKQPAIRKGEILNCNVHRWNQWSIVKFWRKIANGSIHACPLPLRRSQMNAGPPMMAVKTPMGI